MIRFKAGGTGLIDVKFFDEDNLALTPNTITWTLINERNQVVNGRDGVVVPIPAASISIFLQGADLVGGRQTILLCGTYNSNAGSNLPYKRWHTFWVDKPAVSCS